MRILGKQKSFLYNNFIKNYNYNTNNSYEVFKLKEMVNRAEKEKEKEERRKNKNIIKKNNIYKKVISHFYLLHKYKQF